MDIKSKKYNSLFLTKIIVWILCFTTACCAVFAILYTQATGIILPIYAYSDTTEWYENINNFTDILMRAYMTPSEKEIKAETDSYVFSLKEERAQEENSVLKITGFDNLEDAASYYGLSLSEQAPGVSTELTFEIDSTQFIKDLLSRMFEEGELTDPVFQYQIGRLDEIIAKYTKLINEAPEYVENRFIQLRQTALEDIAENDTYLYLITHGSEIIATNLDSPEPLEYFDLADNVFWSVLDSKQHEIYSGSRNLQSSQSVIHNAAYEKGGGDTYNFYVTMYPEAYLNAQIDYNKNYNHYRVGAVLTVLFTSAMAFCFAYLIKNAGVNRYGIVELTKFDIVYLDIGFILMLIGDTIFAVIFASLMSPYYVWQSVSNLDPLAIIGCLGIAAGIVSITLLWAMSLSRRIKLHCAKEYTLVYKVFHTLKIQYQKAQFKSQSVIIFVLYILLGLFIASFGIAAFLIMGDPALTLLAAMFGIIYIICSLSYIFKISGQMSEIEKGVTEIKNGNIDYLIPVEGDGRLTEIAQGVNNIAEGLSYAVSKEVKSAKFKTELITNISHDLKTPLTSILTYIDLLKKEPGLSENVLNYIDILDKKSTRLKILTDDLFDAAKASSGDIAVEAVVLDLVQFIDQVLAEMQDNIKASGLIFISNIDFKNAYVSADGKLLFRVISNIFDNVIKYALPNSRVYISLEENADFYCIIIKNVSKDALNITEEELMERFVRGDSSRNTEGSGLGLSIAKDFMHLMGGKFIIEIDGDLFKAKVYISKAADNDIKGDDTNDAE